LPTKTSELNIFADPKNHLFGATIAGFMAARGPTTHSSSRGVVRSQHLGPVASSIDDPYVKIILDRIAGESWSLILERKSIPLLDRVRIAVFNLGDSEVRSIVLLLDSQSKG